MHEKTPDPRIGGGPTPGNPCGAPPRPAPGRPGGDPRGGRFKMDGRPGLLCCRAPGPDGCLQLAIRRIQYAGRRWEGRGSVGIGAGGGGASCACCPGGAAPPEAGRGYEAPPAQAQGSRGDGAGVPRVPGRVRAGGQPPDQGVRRARGALRGSRAFPPPETALFKPSYRPLPPLPRRRPAACRRRLAREARASEDPPGAFRSVRRVRPAPHPPAHLFRGRHVPHVVDAPAHVYGGGRARRGAPQENRAHRDQPVAHTCVLPRGRPPSPSLVHDPARYPGSMNFEPPVSQVKSSGLRESASCAAREARPSSPASIAGEI